MCQTKANGGDRCIPSATALSRRKLRRKLAHTEHGTKTHIELTKQLEDLGAAYQLYGNCVSPLELPMPKSVERLLKTITAHGNTPLIVGGTVRDGLVGGVNPKDFDVEVYGTDVDELSQNLQSDGYKVDEVGKSFGVLKVVTEDGDDIDLSVPRKDSLSGAGHRGFDIEMDSSLSVEEAAARRDYTFNAMSWDYRYNALIDPHKGYSDLQGGIMRRVSDAFAEDPLRCLRGFQFAGRFNVQMDEETAQYCKDLAQTPKAKELAKERIAGEWEKFYLKSKYPAHAMKTLRDMGWNNHVPALGKVNGDTHNVDSQLTDAYSKSVEDNLSNDQKVTLFSAVIMKEMDDKEAWDFTKHTIITDDLQKSPLMLRKMNPSATPTDYELRRLSQESAQKQVSITDWARYESVTGDKVKAANILKQAQSLNVDKHPEKPLLMGRHIMSMTDRKPGKWMGEIIAGAEERQFRGELRSLDEATTWAQKEIGKMN